MTAGQENYHGNYYIWSKYQNSHFEILVVIIDWHATQLYIA